MRKIIQNLPPSLLYLLLDKTVKNFVTFSMNKNAICVLKSILKAIKKLNKDPLILEFQKRVLGALTINLKSL